MREFPQARLPWRARTATETSVVSSSSCRGQPQPYDGSRGVEGLPAKLRQELRVLGLL